MRAMIKSTVTTKIYGEFKPAKAQAEILGLLNPVFPQPELNPDGFYYFTPDEVRHFNELFERFGLAFRADDEKFDDIGYLTKIWYRLVNGFGGHIECSVYSPKLFALELRDWPEAFREYLAAVMSGNLERAADLALTLKVEDLSIEMPAAMFG